jgi:hypothetical protein
MTRVHSMSNSSEVLRGALLFTVEANLDQSYVSQRYVLNRLVILSKNNRIHLLYAHFPCALDGIIRVVLGKFKRFMLSI